MATLSLLLALAPRAGAQGRVDTVPLYRARVLGVFDSQTALPLEGADVIDLLSKTTARTTATGTVSLAFLPEGGTVVRVQKIGYAPFTQIVAIGPADTVPIIVLLRSSSTTLPAVVTRDSAPRYASPALRRFEERRASGMGGRFVTEAELRKSESRSLANVVRGMGVTVQCSTRTPVQCFATSARMAVFRGACEFDVYVDGMRQSRDDRNLEKMRVGDMAAIEAYVGAATIPPEYNMTGSACGVLLLWSRER